MAPTTPVEKAEKYETESLANLEVRLNLVQTALEPEHRALLNVRVVNGHLQKLEQAVNQYEESIAGIFAVAAEDTDKKKAYSEKLSGQLELVNPLLDGLWNVQMTLKTPEVPPQEPTNQPSKARVTIQLKLRLAQKSIESRLHLIQEAEKQEATQASLPLIKSNLKQLDEVQSLAERELDNICKQVVNGALNEEEMKTLQDEVTQLIDKCAQDVSALKAKFNEAAAQIKESDTDSPISNPASSNFLAYS